VALTIHSATAISTDGVFARLLLFPTIRSSGIQACPGRLEAHFRVVPPRRRGAIPVTILELSFSETGGMTLPDRWRRIAVLESGAIEAALGMRYPYLAVRRAAKYQDGEEQAVLAEVRFGAACCDGHYPACPSVPLVDMGRAMDQAAALLLTPSAHPPRLVAIRALRCEAARVAPPEEAYLVLARRSGAEVVARVLTRAGGVGLASIHGWEHAVDGAPPLSRVPRFATYTRATDECPEVRWQERLDRAALDRLTPQRPPFRVLEAGRVGADARGAVAVQTVARMQRDQVVGHFAGVDALGPMHYARALAQTGMLVASLVTGSDDGVPEVVGGKGLRHDAREYFAAGSEIVTTAWCERTSRRMGRSFVVVRGRVEVEGKPVLWSDGLTYALVARCEHPATAGDGVSRRRTEEGRAAPATGEPPVALAVEKDPPR